MNARNAALLLLLLALPSFAQASELEVKSELNLVLSYMGVFLFAFLFMLVLALVFLRIVAGREKADWGKSVLLDRRLWLLEVLLGLLLISVSFLPGGWQASREVSTLIYVIGAICAFLPLALFLIVAFVTGLYRHGLFEHIVSLSLWGVFAAGASLVLNWLFSQLLSPIARQEYNILLFVVLAPIYEEALKGVGILLAARGGTKASPPVYMLYGLSVGIGFSAIESWLSYTSVTSPLVLGVGDWVRVILYRLFFSNFSHGFFTAALSAMVFGPKGSLKSRMLRGLAVAVGLHALFNYLAIAQPLSFLRPFLVIMLAAGFLHTCFKKS